MNTYNASIPDYTALNQTHSNQYILFWNSISDDINTLNNIKHQIYDHSANYNFFKQFPFSEIKNNISNLNFNIEPIVSTYLKLYNNHYFSSLFDANFFRLFKIETIFDFLKDLNTLNKLNHKYSFIDVNDKKKYIFTIVVFIAIYTSSITINNNSEDIKKTYDNNPLILYYIACYLFFDYLFDDINVDKNIKKNIVKYVNNIFTSKKNINIYNKDGFIDKYIDTINNIFIILFAYDKTNYSLLYDTLINIFNIEAITSNYQTVDHNNKNNKPDINIILNCTILKGMETIHGVWQICDINKDFKKDDKYNKLMNHFGFIFQLLDDLIDIEQDIAENNITIFSYPFIYKYDDDNCSIYLKKNIVKLINYVYSFKNILDEIDINIRNKQKDVFFSMLLIMLNYGISKNSIIKNIICDYQDLFFFKFDDIINFRQLKYSLF